MLHRFWNIIKSDAVKITFKRAAIINLIKISNWLDRREASNFAVLSQNVSYLFLNLQFICSFNNYWCFFLKHLLYLFLKQVYKSSRKRICLCCWLKIIAVVNAEPINNTQKTKLV